MYGKIKGRGDFLKNNKVLISIFMICLFILTACTGNKDDVDAHISSVQEANKKFTQLENGAFSQLTIIENDGEKQTQTVVGTFSVQDNYVDWHTKLVLSESDSNIETIYETIQKAKTQYNRFGQINEDQQFINEDGAVAEIPEWQIIGEGATDYPDALSSLINVELRKEDIDTVEVKEENDLTIYTVTYHDSYVSSMKKNNVTTIKEKIAKAEKENADSNEISNLEASLAYNEVVDYESVKLILTVDDAGVIIQQDVESVFEQKINDTVKKIKMTVRVKIEKYNQTDLKIEL